MMFTFLNVSSDLRDLNGDTKLLTARMVVVPGMQKIKEVLYGETDLSSDQTNQPSSKKIGLQSF